MTVTLLQVDNPSTHSQRAAEDKCQGHNGNNVQIDLWCGDAVDTVDMS